MPIFAATPNRLLLAAVVAFSAMTSLPANATVVAFDYAGVSASGGSFSAELLVTESAFGSTATSISGTRNGQTITSLSSYAAADNILASSAPYLSFSGLSYTTMDGTAYNVYTNGGQLLETNSVVDPFGFGSSDAPVSSVSLTDALQTEFLTNGLQSDTDVPEPAALAMLAAGLLGLGLVKKTRLDRDCQG